MAKEIEPGGWSEYLKAQEAVRERTAKLRALRLEKEQREGRDKEAKAPAKKSPARKGKKATAAKLSDWLEDQRKDGRE